MIYKSILLDELLNDYEHSDWPMRSHFKNWPKNISADGMDDAFVLRLRMK